MSTVASIEALYATAHWLLEQSRLADAAVAFRAMLLAAPSDERGWLGLGTCHERRGQHGIASELYRMANDVAAPAVRCSIARGRALRVLGRDDLAADAFAFAFAAATANGDDALAQIAADEGAVR